MRLPEVPVVTAAIPRRKPRYEIALTVDVRHGDSQRFDEVEVVRLLVENHLIVARHGGFAGNLDDVAMSNASLVEEVHRVSGTSLVARIAATNVAHSSWMTLIGVLIVAGRTIDITRIALESAEADGVAADELNALPYPSAGDRTPFAVERVDRSDPSRNRLVRICFESALGPESALDVIEFLGVWSQLLWGGYVPEGMSPLDCGADASGAYLDTPSDVELPIPNLFADDAAFEAVLFAACRWHERGRRVRSVLVS